MSFRLPKSLRTPDDADAISFLKAYYQERPGTPLGTLKLLYSTSQYSITYISATVTKCPASVDGLNGSADSRENYCDTGPYQIIRDAER